MAGGLGGAMGAVSGALGGPSSAGGLVKAGIAGGAPALGIAGGGVAAAISRVRGARGGARGSVAWASKQWLGVIRESSEIKGADGRA